MYTMDEYQKVCGMTAVYPAKDTFGTIAVNYCLLGLAGEAGELADKMKKVWRGDEGMALQTSLGGSVPEMTEEFRQKVIEELGDCLWYIARAARELGCGLDEVASRNVVKLRDRQIRGVLKGSGDSR